MLKSFFDPSGEFNAAHFVLLSSWSTWTTVLVGLVVVAVLGLAWHNTRRQILRRRGALLSLRVAAVLVLALLFLQPGVRLEHQSRVRNHVVVLVDGSRSMSLPGTSGGTRLDDAKAMLAGSADTLERWSEAHQIDLYSLSDHARPVADANAVEAFGDSTRILTGLEDVASRFRPEDLAAVIVVSDGADNGGLGAALGASDEVPPSARAAAQRLGAPLHAVFTGPDAAPRDVAVVDVAYDDFAFVRNVVSIEASVTVTGFDALQVPVTLRQGSEVLGSKVLQTERGVKYYAFEFEFVPSATGKAVFTLEVGAGPGERITTNNRREFVIRVIRDKIRTLQVVGQPSWDERFLRKLLKKNPNVDLISFFILRTGASLDTTRSRNELSLIPFPTQELFEEQLGSFDLIIFQNFTYHGYNMRQYLRHIREYVRDGGGFVMVGGQLSYSSGGYAGTEIADFLPVELPVERNELVYTDRFRPVLTQAGLRHPITSLSPVPEKNRTLWEGLPELSGSNRVAGVRKGAQVLLSHPSHSVAGQAAPVVSAWGFGEGRVLAVNTDSTWSWDFLAAGEGKDNRHYYRFWGNAIRWLIQDPALKSVRVEADRDRYPLGAEATIVTRVVGPDYQPLKDSLVRLEVKRAYYEGGSPKEEVVHLVNGRTDEAGEFLIRYSPKAEGAYRATAVAALPGGDVDDIDAFVVAPDPVELRNTAARRDTLAALAKAGGGEVRELGDGLKGLARTEPKVVKVNRRRDVPVWASGWLLLLGVLLPSAEWYLRRRWGLL